MTQKTTTKKLCIMASGEGTNAEAIARHFQNIENIEIFCVCNNSPSDANVYNRLQKLGILCTHLKFEENETFFKNNKFDLVALAGYMRILSPETLKHSTFINIHPSLLPKYKGKNAIERTFHSNDDFGGVTIHFVTEELDSGKIIIQRQLPKTNLNLQEFTQKIHQLEHEIYPPTLEKILKTKN